MPSVKQHSEKIDFFEIPGWPYLYISKEGVVWDEYFKEYVRPTYSDRPYPEIKASGSIKPISIHRALALTYLVCPGDPMDYQVEHKDGNKENYKLDNLEWVTRSENAVRAFRNRQRNDNHRVLLKDLETGTVTEHYSITDCAKSLGLHPGYICTYLKRPQSVPFRDKYEIIRLGDNWRFTEEDVGRHNLGRPKNIVAIKDDASEIIIFESISQASAHTGGSHSQIASRAKDKNAGPVNGWRYVYLTDYIGDLSEAKRIKSKRSMNFDKNRFVSTPKPIIVEDNDTKEITLWKSTDEFASYLGLNKKTIQKSMVMNGGWYKNFYIRYSNKSLPSINSSN